MVGLSLAISTVLILLNGVFVGYEFALLKSSPYNLQPLAESGHRGAALALRHKRHVNEFLAVCQLGITAVTLALTVAFEPAVAAVVGPYFNSFMSAKTAQGATLGLSLFIATSVHVTVGELIPKSLALIAPEDLVTRTSVLINVVYRLARPPIRFFNGLSTRLAKMVTGKEINTEQLEHVDVQEALRRSHRIGKIDDAQLEIFDAVLSFPDRMVREVMTPRSDVVFVNPENDVQETLRTVTEHYYTRFPVISNGNVEGYVLVHDLFSHPDFDKIEWKRIIRPITKIPETVTLPRVHKTMAGTPIAAVYDEYNEFVGIITHSDIHEEIMGRLLDEDDEEEPPLIQNSDDGSYIINATENVTDVLDALNIFVDKEELDGVDSFGGLLLAQLGREPNEGDEVEWSGFHFRVEKAERFRIMTVRARRLDPEADSNLNGVDRSEAR